MYCTVVSTNSLFTISGSYTGKILFGLRIEYIMEIMIAESTKSTTAKNLYLEKN
ncbi:hypothetical protein GCM10022259_13070 [Aquimarina mytili]